RQYCIQACLLGLVRKRPILAQILAHTVLIGLATNMPWEGSHLQNLYYVNSPKTPTMDASDLESKVLVALCSD
ncbi:uncharacterized protein K444DRAFT_695895, partial [Hyaloscypha bicolor E]